MNRLVDWDRHVEYRVDLLAGPAECLLVSLPPFCPGPGVIVPHLGDDAATWRECMRLIYYMRERSMAPLATGRVVVTSFENLSMFSAEDLLFSRAFGHPDHMERVNALTQLAYLLCMIRPGSSWH